MHEARRAEIERLAVTDSRALREGVLELLRRRMAFDWFVFVLTDPRTTVGTDPLAHVPDGLSLPALIRRRYLSAHHRWTSLTGASTLGAEPAESRVWREVQSAYGVVDVLSCVLADSHGCWGFLDLWSTTLFGAMDLDLVDAVTPTLTASVRRSQAEALRPRGPVTPAGPVVLLLDDDLRVVGETDPTLGWLTQLLPPAAGRPPVPAIAYNVGAQLIAIEHGIDDHEPAGRVHLDDGVWISVRAARLAGSGQIAVSMEQVTGPDRRELVVRAFGLSPREAAVLTEVCAGGSTADIAGVLHVSPLTVQDHLKSVFHRTGVRSRGELTALALGATSTPT